MKIFPLSKSFLSLWTVSELTVRKVHLSLFSGLLKIQQISSLTRMLKPTVLTGGCKQRAKYAVFSTAGGFGGEVDESWLFKKSSGINTGSMWRNV